MFNVRVAGLKKFQTQTGKMPKRIARGISRAIKKSAFIIQRESQIALTVGRTRAIDTGRLKSDTVVRTLKPTIATIYPIVNYALFVHEGTSRMRARPFMKVGVQNARDEIKKQFRKELKSAIKITRL